MTLNEAQLEQVDTYVKSERQWPRALRIAHAKMKIEVYQRKMSWSRHEYTEAVDFWRAVLERNEG